MGKKDNAVFLPVWDDDGKPTLFKYFSEIKPTEDGKHESVLKERKPYLNEKGEQVFQAMNRKARRILESRKNK